MKNTIQKGLFLEKLTIASRFTLNKLGLNETLRGILLKGDGENIHIYSTNLNSYYHSHLPFKTNGGFSAIIDTKKIVEFLILLEGESVDIEIEKSQIRFSQGKTVGTFPYIKQEEFPLPPEIKESGQQIKTGFFLNNLPLVLFSASKDESRPALNAVNFIDMEGELGIVSTDGFRLSLLKTKKEDTIPSMLIPSGFFYEILKYFKGEETVSFFYSEKEKTVLFKIKEDSFYSRLIDGELPPFEKVIPIEKKTTCVLDREELLIKIKLVSIFAREASNIVVCEFSKNGLIMRPKVEGGRDNSTQLETSINGEEQTVAFNYRFILDLLNNITDKRIVIEILRPDAPVVFRVDGRKDFIYIIMPVRIQE